MKNKLRSILVALSLVMPVAYFSIGCATTGQISQSTIDATAVVIQGAAQAGATVAIQQDPGNAKYFKLAADGISTFLTATNYTPGAFQASLMTVIGSSGGALTNAYVQIGFGTVIDLYELYYGQYVKGQVNGNAYAGEFLKAVQNGFYLALGQPPLQLRPGRLSAAPGPIHVLPRPIYRVKR